jgi:hypothetical protein
MTSVEVRSLLQTVNLRGSPPVSPSGRSVHLSGVQPDAPFGCLSFDSPCSVRESGVRLQIDRTMSCARHHWNEVGHVGSTISVECPDCGSTGPHLQVTLWPTVRYEQLVLL